MQNSATEQHHKHSKKLSLWTTISLVIGCSIGSGVFVKPGKVLLAAGSSNHALLAWLIGGLITIAGGLTLSEITSRIPKTGGLYVYMEELYGKAWGFVCGWVQSIIYGPALISALSLYFASIFTQFTSLAEDHYTKPIALIALFFLAAVCSISTAAGAFIQNATTMLKLLPIAVIGICGLMMGDAPIFNVELASSAQAAGMGVAILATLWAYDGWVQVTALAGEMQNPAKNLPKALVIGLLVVMSAYLLVNLSLFHVLPVEQIAALNEKSASVAAEVLFGTWGGKFLTAGILLSIFGCLNGNILAMSRVPFAMAQRKNFPYPLIFSYLHPKAQTPVHSIILKTFVASIMILMLNPDRITDIAIFSMYLFYAAVFVGVAFLRKKMGVPKKGEYKIPFYPVVPLIAILGSLYICFSMYTNAPMDALVSLGVAALGFPVYYGMNKKRG